MTVASLWKALDQAGCGQPLGEEDMIDPHRKTAKVNPWTYNEGQRRYQHMEDRPSLAVDLSIWVCESLTSSAMNDHNENPTLHLVFTRTMKLLSMGIKLIYVIEGKRRIRCSPGENQDKFRRRRSGTSFWKACKQCEEMLELLGVPVVRAKAEGEALCALLNQQAIVDGVISNDGDCLLFGAKVVYTKFSMENLEKGCVMRYEASQLYAVADASSNDEDDVDDIAENNNVDLSREDLIAFALLTGSDLAGDGLAKVGHKKAVRFIKKCRRDYPLSPQTAAIEELKSWARSASVIVANDDTKTGNEDCMDEQEVDDNDNNEAKKKKKQTCCSRCDHVGSKRNHEKHGCEICGTEPGEPCYKLSADDKFRKSLRQKALAMTDPKFDPTLVVEAYMRPNDNQLPASLLLAGMSSSKSLRMKYPRLKDIVAWPVVVKGHSLKASQEYLKQAVARLLARTELFQNSHDNDAVVESNPGKQHRCSSLPRDRPVPKQIVRKLVQNRIDCYEVCWAINATITDKDGEGIDGYEFSTIEPQDMVKRLHPQLVQTFDNAPKEFKKQGDAEMQKRREFLQSLFQPAVQDETNKQSNQRRLNKDERNFTLPVPSKHDDALLEAKQQHRKNEMGLGGDVEQILRFTNAATKSKQTDNVGDFDFSSIESDSLRDEEQKEQGGEEQADDKLLINLKEVDQSQVVDSQRGRACGDRILPNYREEELTPHKEGHNRCRKKKKKKQKKKRTQGRRVTFAGTDKHVDAGLDAAGPPKPNVVGTRKGSFHQPTDVWDDMSSVTNGSHVVQKQHPAKQEVVSATGQLQKMAHSHPELTRKGRPRHSVERRRECSGPGNGDDRIDTKLDPEGGPWRSQIEDTIQGVSPEQKRNRLNRDAYEQGNRGISIGRRHQACSFDHDGDYGAHPRDTRMQAHLTAYRSSTRRRDETNGEDFYLGDPHLVCKHELLKHELRDHGGKQRGSRSHGCRNVTTDGEPSKLSEKDDPLEIYTKEIAIRGVEDRQRGTHPDDYFIDDEGCCWRRMTGRQRAFHPGEIRETSYLNEHERADQFYGSHPWNMDDNSLIVGNQLHLRSPGDSKGGLMLQDKDKSNEHNGKVKRRCKAEQYDSFGDCEEMICENLDDEFNRSYRQQVAHSRHQQGYANEEEDFHPMEDTYQDISNQFEDLSIDTRYHHMKLAPGLALEEYSPKGLHRINQYRRHKPPDEDEYFLSFVEEHGGYQEQDEVLYHEEENDVGHERAGPLRRLKYRENRDTSPHSLHRGGHFVSSPHSLHRASHFTFDFQFCDKLPTMPNNSNTSPLPVDQRRVRRLRTQEVDQCDTCSHESEAGNEGYSTLRCSRTNRDLSCIDNLDGGNVYRYPYSDSPRKLKKQLGGRQEFKNKHPKFDSRNSWGYFGEVGIYSEQRECMQSGRRESNDVRQAHHEEALYNDEPMSSNQDATFDALYYASERTEDRAYHDTSIAMAYNGERNADFHIEQNRRRFRARDKSMHPSQQATSQNEKNHNMEDRHQAPYLQDEEQEDPRDNNFVASEFVEKGGREMPPERQCSNASPAKDRVMFCQMGMGIELSPIVRTGV